VICIFLKGVLWNLETPLNLPLQWKLTDLHIPRKNNLQELQNEQCKIFAHFAACAVQDHYIIVARNLQAFMQVGNNLALKMSFSYKILALQ